MTILPILLIFGAVGTFGAQHTDIDFNRVKRLPNAVPKHSAYKQIPRPSLGKSEPLIIRINDYDDHSSWHQHPRASIPAVHSETKTADPEPPIYLYQPREDPRLFYQSDAYLKKYGRENVDEVSYIYPGRDVIRADENNPEQYSQLRSNYVDTGSTTNDDSGICVKCPNDRTLVAKATFGRVVLQKPFLRACSGRKAPRTANFVQLYGPRFGSLLDQGSYVIIGQIMERHKKLQLCKMQVHVVVQGCVSPKYLVAHCWDHNKQCIFTCRDSHLELKGPPTQTCGDDLKWKGELPVCKAQTWCPLPSPPEHGRVSCQGATANAGTGLAEGSRCRVHCARGYRSLRTSPVCRRGLWTHALVCQPKRNVIRKN